MEEVKKQNLELLGVVPHNDMIYKYIKGAHMFEEMLKAARERLSGRDAEDISKKTHLKYDKEERMFYLISLGKEISISYPEYETDSEINEWHLLTILHYMDMADGIELTGNMITFGGLKNGMIRGGGFDRQCENTFSRMLEKYPQEVVRNACEALGAEIVSSNADLCAVFSYLPMYPVTLKIWFADEEIQGTGKLFLDKCADFYLSVEDAVTVGTVLLEELIKNC